MPVIATRDALLAEFAARIDAAAAHRLTALAMPEAFADAVLALAAARGSALTRDMLHGAAPPIAVTRWPGAGWLPAAVSADAVEWLHFADVAVDRPFFHDAVQTARARPFNRLFRRRMTLADFLAAAPAPQPPDALVLHMSRCGSTLVAQMLSAMRGTRAIAEPQPIDGIVAAQTLDEATRIAALRAVAHAFRRPGERLILKLDAWHALSLPLLRRAFPDTPWAFLFRDGAEVIVSHLRERGIHTVPGLVALPGSGIAPDESGVPVEDYVARVVGAICAGVVRDWGVGGGIAIDYAALPAAVTGHILPHFGIVPDAAERTALAVAARRDAKAPGAQFAADSSAKQAAADAAVHAAAARHIAAPLAALRALPSAPR